MSDCSSSLLPTPEAKLSDSGPDYARFSRPRSGGPDLITAVALNLLPTPTQRDYKGPNQRGDDSCLHGALLPTPTAANPNDGESLDSWEARRQRNLAKGVNGNGQGTPLGIAVRRDWGKYDPAIRRWESITRPAPAPTMTGPRGGERLNPAFVEWMMGLPEGWVTGVAGLTRTQQLKLLGNGVVPQQAAAAYQALLNTTATEESTAA